MNAVDPGAGNVPAEVGGRSLWDKVPNSLRLELIPLASTAVLVQNGRNTAEALTKLRNVVFGGEVKPIGLDDLTGLFLLVNFTILLWFAHRTLREALEKAGEPSLSAKLIGLSTGFLTVTELYSYALKSGHLDRLVFAIPVILYVFYAPFFLVRDLGMTSAHADEQGQKRRVALHASAAFELVLHALVPGVAAILVGSAYFGIMNKGIGTLLSAPIDMLGQSAGTAFWGFSPGIVGIAWLPVLLGHARRAEPDGSLIAGLDGVGRARLYRASAAMAAVLGVVLVDDGGLVPGGKPIGTAPISFLLAKAFLGVLILAVFVACSRCVSVLVRRRTPAATSAVGTMIFALGGAASAAALVALRQMFVQQGQSAVALMVLHAVGFVLAYLAGLAAIRRLRRWLPDVSSPLDAGGAPLTPAQEVRA